MINRRLLYVIGLLLVFTTPFASTQRAYADNPIQYAENADELIGAIHSANGFGGATTIVLTDTINLTAADNSDATLGANGLPIIMSDITLEGQGFTITHDEIAPNFRIFQVAAGGSLTLLNVTVDSGVATSGTACDSCGGGLYNAGDLTITHSVIRCNTAAQGGGLYNANTATISDSNVICNSTNTSTVGGGGLYNNGEMTVNDSIFNYNVSLGNGGGLFNNGNLTLNGTTFSSDSASQGGGGLYSKVGGEATINGSTFSQNTAANGGGIYTQGIMNIQNSTFSANSASSDGGGLFNSGDFTTANSTFSGNRATLSGGGVFNTPTDSMFLSNSIIANSPAGGDCSSSGLSPSFLLVDDDSCGISPDNNINLNILDNYGGNTVTFALTTVSSALDAADNGVCVGSTVNGIDQRGVMRGIDANGISNNPQFGDCDIGAFEYGGVIRTLGFAAPASSTILTATTVFPVTLTLDAPLANGYAPINAYVWVSGGTAVAGTDYAPFGVQTATFNPGDTTATVALNLLNAPEASDKTIILSIAADHGFGFSGPARLGGQLTHTVTIKLSPTNAAPTLNDFATHTPTLTWNSVPGAIGYDVQVDTDTTFNAPYAFSASGISAGQLYVQTSSLANGTYHWRVRAELPNGKFSAWSTAQSFTVFGQ